MRGINKAIIVGNLGADPEVRAFPNGGSVANVNIATTDSWTDKQTGERKERTEWHRVVFFSRLAEIAGQYLRKGSKVYVEGRLQTRKWQGQDGQDRYTTEIIVSDMQMLDSRGGAQQAAPPRQGPQQSPQSPQEGPAGTPAVSQATPPPQGAEDFDDDIPF